jgi:adenosine deaminase
LGLSKEQISTLQRNSIEMSFLTDQEKQNLLALKNNQ